MDQLAAEIWKDGPVSDPSQPYKPAIRAWGTRIEQIVSAFVSNGGLLYSTKAALLADLAHASNSSAWVLGDPVAANNGIYVKSGAAGAGTWTRVSDLPFSFIIASDDGTGTPNAIHATSPIPVSGSALVVLTVSQANSGSPVTVSFNGAAPLTIKTNSGNDIAAGGLAPGMILFGYITDTTFRCVNDQISSAIVAAAEAAADRAETAEAVVAGLVSAVTPVFASKALAEAYVPETAPSFVQLAGCQSPGDLGGAFYRKLNSEPAHVGKLSITTTGGTISWYVLAVAQVTPQMFGAVGDGVADDADAVRAAVAVASVLKASIFYPGGRYLCSGKISHTFSPSATGPDNDKNSYATICMDGAGHDLAVVYFPDSDGFEFLCSSFQHIVCLRGFSITTGANGGGNTGLRIHNSFAYFGEYNARHEIDVTIHGDDGYGGSNYWSYYIDLFNASNLNIGRNCNLVGTPLGAGDASYGTGVRIVSDPDPDSNPDTHNSTEPGWGTGYNLTGIKTKYLGCAVEIGKGIQGVTLGPGTEILVGYNGVHVLAGATEIRQINLIGAQISVNGDAYLEETAVSSFVAVGNYIAVAAGKNGLVRTTDAGAANGGGTLIVGNTFVASGAGASDGIYINTSFCPTIIEGNVFKDMNTSIELGSGSQNVLVGINAHEGVNNRVIDSGTNNRVTQLADSKGAVTQLTSKATAVTLNTLTGDITTNSSALAAGAVATFTVNNNKMAAEDTIEINVTNANYSARAYNHANGSFGIALKNESGSALGDPVVVRFSITKRS